MRKFKLLKDLPFIKAGEIGEYEKNLNIVAFGEGTNTPYFFRNTYQITAAISEGWLEEIKEPMGFVLEEGEFYFCFHAYNVKTFDFRNDGYEEKLIKIGNCFKTEQEAQDCLDNYIKPAFIKYWEDQK
jgi:hypothetical protein